MAAKRLESVRGRGTTAARRRRGREGNTDITLNYCIVSGRRRRGGGGRYTAVSVWLWLDRRSTSMSCGASASRPASA